MKIKKILMNWILPSIIILAMLTCIMSLLLIILRLVFTIDPIPHLTS